MTQFRKVLWVKFGWSDYYRGGSVDGNFGWLKEIKGGKHEGKGHEALNFMPINGIYYCYVPPQGSIHAPWNDENTGWTVICLAKNPKHPGIHLVGWYEDATLLGEWQEPPDALDASILGTTFERTYCIKSPLAFFINPNLRTRPFSHNSIRQGKYSFLSGPDIETTQTKSEIIDLLKAEITAVQPIAVPNPSEENLPDPELDDADPLKFFGTPEHRKEVEKKAESAVIAYYRKLGFSPEDCTKLNCGYDFRFHDGRTELHVEVKGTSGETPSFFLTRNEHSAGYLSNPAWRLAIVTNALSSKPVVTIFDAPQLRKAFELNPYVYLARPFIPSKAV